ncbi:MAG: indole-3-glycerol-phosphate synthase TrpC [Sphingomonadales bacterium]|nr:indole-3-glycerol-phosphate synthase TrpC [Sphingomonadales bacterium]
MADPPGVLGKIVRRKRVDVASRLGGATLSDLAARAGRSRRSLAAALARPGARFILEVKRASPSRGAIRGDLDPAALARGWRGAADAISVLTDGPYFGGSFADLAAVRAAFDGPVLAKDFIVDPRQVAEARLHGADAVLAMLSVLGEGEARAVFEAAERLGMDVLTEVHDRAELDRALALGAKIIGIDLRAGHAARDRRRDRTAAR